VVIAIYYYFILKIYIFIHLIGVAFEIKESDDRQCLSAYRRYLSIAHSLDIGKRDKMRGNKRYSIFSVYLLFLLFA